MISDMTPSLPHESSTTPADTTNAGHMDAAAASANAASPSVTANDLNGGSAPSSAHGDIDKVADDPNGTHAPPAAAPSSSVVPSPLEQNGMLLSMPTAVPVPSTTAAPQPPIKAPSPTDPSAPIIQSTPQLTISTQDATMTDASEPQTFTYHPLKVRSRISVRLDGQESQNGVVLDVTGTTNEPSRPTHQGRTSGKQPESDEHQNHYSYYIHLDESDHRMDRWIEAEHVFPPVPVLHPTPPRAPSPSTASNAHHPSDASVTALGKRKRAELESLGKGIFDPEYVPNADSSSPSLDNLGIGSSPRHRDQRDRDRDKHLVRNVQRVVFGAHDIGTWYYSPYPLEEEDVDVVAETNGNGHAGHRGPSPVANQVTTTAHGQKQVGHLFVCEGCFKYILTPESWSAHIKECTYKHPPGRRVYQRGAHTIWEVQGSQQKLYAQCLSLFGKLFIDHKTIFFDVEPFVFYVLTDASSSFDHPMGYFSKEIVSYDDYNLACIVTFPPYQCGGFGSLMVEFSYYLSARAGCLGSPERPLSDLGLRGYRSFWTKQLLLTLGYAFNLTRIRSAVYPKVQFTEDASMSQAARAASRAALAEWRTEVARVRALLVGESAPLHPGTIPEDQMSEAERQALRRQRRPLKGWAGESGAFETSPAASSVPLPAASDAGSSSGTKPRPSDAVGPAASAGKRRRNTSLSAEPTLLTASPAPPSIEEDYTSRDIPATFMSSVDITAEPPPLLFLETTMERLARACNLRPEDVCVALAHSGLLIDRLDPQDLPTARSSPAAAGAWSAKQPSILLSCAKVTEILSTRTIKKPLMELKYVLI